LKRNRRGNSANWSGPELAALFVAAWWCPLLCVSFKSEDWVNSSQKLWMNTHTHYIYTIYIYILYIYMEVSWNRGTHNSFVLFSACPWNKASIFMGYPVAIFCALFHLTS
jgi:hypothetical protein